MLSSAAIGAVYLAGYLGTQGADASLSSATTTATSTGGMVAATTSSSTSQVTTSASAATTGAPAVAAPPAVTRTAAVASTTRSTQKVAPRPTATATPVPQPTATATPTPTGLRAGTYTGVGDSRRGSIQVALTVKGGKITNVAITDATTQYPVSWISTLPGEVVATQSAQVDLVSGATFSSMAFEGAVQQALAQAQA
jgi:uncharacterized protein with FMN-binding domain